MRLSSKPCVGTRTDATSFSFPALRPFSLKATATEMQNLNHNILKSFIGRTVQIRVHGLKDRVRGVLYAVDANLVLENGDGDIIIRGDFVESVAECCEYGTGDKCELTGAACSNGRNPHTCEHVEIIEISVSD